MKRSLYILLVIATVAALSALLPPTAVNARQLFQHVLVTAGTAASPTNITATGSSLNVAAPAGITCVVAVSTATTITAVGGSCVAPGAGQSIHITDIAFGSSAASGTAADSFPTLKSGTGGTCGAATTVVWEALSTANSTVTADLTRPIKLTANHELCWIMSTAGSKTVVITGFVAP